MDIDDYYAYLDGKHLAQQKRNRFLNLKKTDFDLYNEIIHKQAKLFSYDNWMNTTYFYFMKGIEECLSGKQLNLKDEHNPLVKNLE